jgi:hypothetical protein
MHIAAVASLNPKNSVHTPTFLRAVELAKAHALPPQTQVTLFDDEASAEGAASAAREILEARPDAVVGHFASSAAHVAAPLYAAAGLKLILPAATRSDLTQNATTYRVCDHDAAYVDWLCDTIATPIHAALSDGTAHGDSVVNLIRSNPCFHPSDKPQTVVISGMYGAVLKLAAQTHAPDIVLTDDADLASLATDLRSAGVDLTRKRVRVAALHTEPRGPIAETILRIEPAPGTYFWETIAALQVAAQPGPLFDTVLGPMGFDANREANPQSFILKTITAPLDATSG